MGRAQGRPQTAGTLSQNVPHGDEHTFDKLAELLRPILERNEYYASESQVEIRESVAGCVLVNLRALSVYILVVLLVSAALRSVLVTNSLLHWTQLLNMVHSCSVLVTNSIVHWTRLLNMVRSCSAARECCSTSCLCDQLSFTITIVHCTQLLNMVHSCSVLVTNSIVHWTQLLNMVAL